jgi:hypothetical protein
MHDEEPMDLGALRASEEARQRVVGGAMARIRKTEARDPMGLLAETIAWPARLAPLILPAAAAIWLVLLLRTEAARAPATVGQAMPESTIPLRLSAPTALGFDPAVLTAAWGLDGPGGFLAVSSPDQLLVTLAETSP